MVPLPEGKKDEEVVGLDVLEVHRNISKVDCRGVDPGCGKQRFSMTVFTGV